MKACFFDIDGTLFDTRLGLAATVNHTRRDLSLREFPVEEVLCHVGRGARYLLANAIPEKADEVEALWERFMSHYAEHTLDGAAPYPTVFETLTELQAHGWRLGINTAKPAFATKMLLEHFGFVRFFGEAVIAAGDCPEMKPSALPLQACAARMDGHVLSSDDWMVGDNWTDIACAANAGVKGAFCTFGFGTLKDAKPTASINRMEELLPLLKATAADSGRDYSARFMV